MECLYVERKAWPQIMRALMHSMELNPTKIAVEFS